MFNLSANLIGSTFNYLGSSTCYFSTLFYHPHQSSIFSHHHGRSPSMIVTPLPDSLLILQQNRAIQCSHDHVLSLVKLSSEMTLHFKLRVKAKILTTKPKIPNINQNPLPLIPIFHSSPPYLLIPLYLHLIAWGHCSSYFLYPDHSSCRYSLNKYFSLKSLLKACNVAQEKHFKMKIELLPPQTIDPLQPALLSLYNTYLLIICYMIYKLITLLLIFIFPLITRL